MTGCFKVCIQSSFCINNTNVKLPTTCFITLRPITPVRFLIEFRIDSEVTIHKHIRGQKAFLRIVNEPCEETFTRR